MKKITKLVCLILTIAMLAAVITPLPVFASDVVILTYCSGGNNNPPPLRGSWRTWAKISKQVPTLPGYTFGGWQSREWGAKVYQPGEDVYLVSSFTAYAQWYKEPTPSKPSVPAPAPAPAPTPAPAPIRTYTLSYNANGGTGAPASQVVNANTSTTVNYSYPTRPNYVFQGWSTYSSATTAQYVGGSSIYMTGNVILYAVWQARTMPVYVVYFKDRVGGEILGQDYFNSPLPVGAPITGIKTNMYAPAGYTVPGEISGDLVIKQPQSIVYVVYTKPVEKNKVYVKYYKDSLNGDLLGTESFESSNPLGSAITGVNTSLYAPAGYKTPGSVSGDAVLKSPYSLVYVVYTKVEKKIPVYVMYYLDSAGGKYLGADYFETALPVGTSIDKVGIDLRKYAPEKEYKVPGFLAGGDAFVSEPITHAIVVYRRYPD